MRDKKKKQKEVRTRDWSEKHEDAFTHDRTRHVRAVGAASVEPRAEIASWDAQPNAIVVSHTGRYAFVHMDGREHLCLIDERLGAGTASLLAPGDAVQVELADGQQPTVRALAPRRTKLSRLAGVHAQITEQVIAANVDQLVVVASVARPAFKPGLVDRYLVAAEVGSVTPLLVINKIDLLDREPEEVALYREIGLTVLRTSCVTGAGIPELRAALEGKLSVLAGNSGVGKTSLLNVLDPALSLAIQEVSASTHKGRHTTTTARLHVIEGGIRIIDTPGARTLGLWGVSAAEVAYYFPEMQEFAPACRFRDCTHTHEPGCAVRAAVDSGEIPRLRYESYLRIRGSLQEVKSGHELP